jgi:hypothetical protein
LRILSAKDIDFNGAGQYSLVILHGQRIKRNLFITQKAHVIAPLFAALFSIAA